LSDPNGTIQQWLPVIAKSLAHLCLQYGDLKDKTLADRALFLEALGIERKEVAAMLGTTAASITEMLRVKRNKKGPKKRATKKAR